MLITATEVKNKFSLIMDAVVPVFITKNGHPKKAVIDYEKYLEYKALEQSAKKKKLIKMAKSFLAGNRDEYTLMED